MEKALKVISRWHKEGVLEEYAIGGAIATIYYTDILERHGFKEKFENFRGER